MESVVVVVKDIRTPAKTVRTCSWHGTTPNLFLRTQKSDFVQATKKPHQVPFPCLFCLWLGWPVNHCQGHVPLRLAVEKNLRFKTSDHEHRNAKFVVAVRIDLWTQDVSVLKIFLTQTLLSKNIFEPFGCVLFFFSSLCWNLRIKSHFDCVFTRSKYSNCPT